MIVVISLTIFVLIPYISAMTNNNNMIFAQLFIALMHIICTVDALSINRRHYLQKQTGGCIASLILTNNQASAQAANEMKSRTDGYAIQHTEREWAYILSGSQYNILRRGGTERQKSSILNTFTILLMLVSIHVRGVTHISSSIDKFSSGTGWPSFSDALEGRVEVEDVRFGWEG